MKRELKHRIALSLFVIGFPTFLIGSLAGGWGQIVGLVGLLMALFSYDTVIDWVIEIFRVRK